MIARATAIDGVASRRPLKVGLFLPFAERMLDGETPRWADILAMAQLAEEIGFDSLWLGDHLLVPGDETVGPWEAWSLISALAAATRRVQIGPLVAATSFRNPALFAKMADTVDEISGGRLVLGLGTGYVEREYRAFGYPFDHRVSRFEEALQIITCLLRTGQVDHDGTYYQARECELRPRGPRPGGPPILIGALGTGSRMMGLVARYADAWNGWLVTRGNSLDLVAPLRTAVDDECRAIGRDPATLEHTVSIAINATEKTDSPRAWPSPAAITPITGTPESLAAALRAFASEGVEHIQLAPRPCTLAGVEALAPVLALLDSGR